MQTPPEQMQPLLLYFSPHMQHLTNAYQFSTKSPQCMKILPKSYKTLPLSSIFSPLLTMHESRYHDALPFVFMKMHVKAYTIYQASQIYKEHNKMLQMTHRASKGDMV